MAYSLLLTVRAFSVSCSVSRRPDNAYYALC